MGTLFWGAFVLTVFEAFIFGFSLRDVLGERSFGYTKRAPILSGVMLVGFGAYVVLTLLSSR